jgi:tetratricopeptide (TPR) repeat protein
MDRLTILQQYHEEDPDDSFIRFAMASEYVKLGDDPSARSWFESLRDNDPDYVGTYFHLGKLYERLGIKEQAIATYQAGATVATKVSDFHARSELQSALLEAEGLGFD